ncbi:GNAT family N-acetyltransferase [Bacillus massilinigeriensis]|uniref:GNAT family N-acetyltransferase n=1 Tax=Bacillus mediterraneensis TaxID=1805474 RepID=UPI0008F89E8C|nr:GNAT family N-acetyltransferase [Bacillus mediterraneensis]
MTIELLDNNTGIAASFFQQKYQIPAQAVIHGRFPGKVFVDHEENPEIALAWAVSRWSYIAGENPSSKHFPFMKEVLEEIVSPMLKITGEKYFEIYCDNNSVWDDFFHEFHGNSPVRKHLECTYTLNEAKFQEYRASLEMPDDIEIQEIKLPIIPENFRDIVLEEKQLTTGFTLVKDGQTLSQCINNGFIHHGHYFIDLDTFCTQERNKGYGTLAACQLISHQLDQGLSPLWETTNSNIPSQAVAKKLGFEPAEEYAVYTICGFST